MANKKILVVDDDQELREALTTALKLDGYEVITAENGKDGLDTAIKERPDLILLDIWMPRMNGHEMLKQLRRNAWGETVRVVLLTNADDATNVSLASELDGDEYLIKSHTSLETIRKIAKQQLNGYFN